LRNLAETCLALRQPVEAAQAARELAELMAGRPGELYDAARFLARCAGTAKEGMADGTLTDDQQRRYADEAIATLRSAVTAGWSNAKHTANDPALASLHARADFRFLIMDLTDRSFPADPFQR